MRTARALPRLQAAASYPFKLHSRQGHFQPDIFNAMQCMHGNMCEPLIQAFDLATYVPPAAVDAWYSASCNNADCGSVDAAQDP